MAGLSMEALSFYHKHDLYRTLQLARGRVSRQIISSQRLGELVSSFLMKTRKRNFKENNGDTDWPAGCSLQYVSGAKLTNQTQIPVEPLNALTQTDGKYALTLIL